MWLRFRMGVLTLNDLTKKNFSPLYPAPWVFINSRYRQVDKHKEPSQLLYYGLCVCVFSRFSMFSVFSMLQKRFHLEIFTWLYFQSAEISHLITCDFPDHLGQLEDLLSV